MTDEDLTKLAKIQSLVAKTHESIAKIEAMKAFNDFRRVCDQSPGYGETEFFQESEVLEKIASDLTEFF